MHLLESVFLCVRIKLMLKQPFYDPLKSYDENYMEGPFGLFADGIKIKEPLSIAQYEFLGHKVNLPFGIPAGPLLNSNFIKAAFGKGYDIPVYKTVRSGNFPCHPFPNILGVHLDSDLTLIRAQKPLLAWREPVETNAEEVLIQALDYRRGGLLNHLQGDGRGGGAIP